MRRQLPEIHYKGLHFTEGVQHCLVFLELLCIFAYYYFGFTMLCDVETSFRSVGSVDASRHRVSEDGAREGNEPFRGVESDYISTASL